MKVCMIDPNSYGNLGNYDRLLLDSIKSENILIGNIKYENYLTKFKFIKLFSYSDKKKFLKILSYAFSLLKLCIFINKKKFDILHFQWFKAPQLDYLVLLYLKKIKKNKIVYTAHNLLPHDSEKKFEKIYGKIYNCVDKIIVHTEVTKKEIIEKFGIKYEKINVVPHGLLEINKFNNCSTKDEIIEKKEGEIIFSIVGSLNYYKGVDLIIDAWSQEVELYNNNNIKLIIAGKGKINISKIRDKKNVIIINRFLENEELEEIIEKTDVQLLPYRAISQSGVLLSTLLKKKPILVSNVGGLVQPFEMGEIGWILEEISSQEICKKIKLIINQKDKIKKIKEDDLLWEAIHSYYSWEKIGEKTLDIYKQIKTD